eukprot:3288007-Prymnesium_polylepis.1
MQRLFPKPRSFGMSRAPKNKNKKKPGTRCVNCVSRDVSTPRDLRSLRDVKRSTEQSVKAPWRV